MAHPTVIVGAGLAGCTLAWELHLRGRPVVLVDREEPVTSSKVAAGLIAPLSGPRLLPGWRFDDAWAAAAPFYLSIEDEFDERVFHHKTKLHLFADGAEHDLFRTKRAAEFARFVRTDSPVIDAETCDAPHGGFEMSHAGWLDVPAYLTIIQRYFKVSGAYVSADLDPARDLRWNGPRVEIPSLDLTAEMVVWCEGPTATRNPFFPGVRFNLAKGEVLTLHVPDLRDERIIHRGVWLFRVADGVYRCGSTFEWKDVNSGPTAVGRETILARLRSFLKCPVEVLDHTAAVRPVIEDLKPMIGVHPRCRQLAFFNGLGSKGALLAPMVARQLCQELTKPTDGSPWETSDLSLTRPCGLKLLPRLTDLAHTLLAPVIKPGDLVIDATAGNGHDTAFLAKCVRTKGTVFAIDRQSEAVTRLTRLVSETPLPQVTLIQDDHAALAALIPAEQHGRVAVVMFNLGYLPNSDHAVTTTAETTAQALRQAVSMLRPGGMLTVLAYTGHPGGPEEAAAVAATLTELEAELEWGERFAEPWLTNPPRLFVGWKKGSSGRQ